MTIFRIPTLIVPPMALVAILVTAMGCAATSDEQDPEARCQALTAQLASCFPELQPGARCTAETLDQAEAMVGQSCGDLEAQGKADVFAFGGCGANEHVCGHVFCCADYVLTWFPEQDSDWDLVPVVDALLAGADSDALDRLDQATEAELSEGVGVTFQQEVRESLDTPARRLAVEITRRVYPVSWEVFNAKMAPASWGPNLRHWLGGQTYVYETDTLGRPTRQLERMVLSPLPIPLDFEAKLTNNDMTKVELIHYGEDSATVYWRVMHSDNASTITDVGSVDFRRYDSDHTVATFHSAHDLASLGGIHIPIGIVEKLLKPTFLDFLDGYATLIGRN